MTQQVALLLVRIQNNMKASQLGVREFYHRFTLEDTEGAGVISVDQFRRVICSAGGRFTNGEMGHLANFFGDGGFIVYHMFIQELRGELSEFRSQIVQRAFRFLDKSKGGQVSFQHLVNAFDAARDPAVLAGTLSEEQALEAYVRSWQGYYDASCGVVTLNDFLDYYKDVAPSYPTDMLFAQSIAASFRMGPMGAVVSEAAIDRLESIIVAKVHQKSPNVFVTMHLKKTFKFYDKDNDGVVDFDEFCAAIQTYGVYARKEELVALFSRYDRDFSETVTFMDFVEGLKEGALHRNDFIGQI